MQVSDEVVSIAFIKGHKRASHNDKLYLVSIVAKSFQLFDAILGLEIWIVPGSDCPHRCRLISSITLCGVLEVTVRSTRAIYANVTSHGDVRATMRLGHDSYDCDATCCAYGFSLENRRELILVRLRQGGKYIDDLGHACQFILCSYLNL